MTVAQTIPHFRGVPSAEQELTLETSPHYETFDAVYCLNLERRGDRWEQFQERIPHDWPFRPIQRVAAIDGRRVPQPEWWKQGGGAWGCYRTHLHLIEQAINSGKDSILLLEDDAEFCPDFRRRVTQFLDALPDDWGMIYLGGQHLFINAEPPGKINDRVFQPYNVNRTHAFALRGATMREVYRHLCRRDWQQGHHIDHHLGRLHQRRDHPIYCPHQWLVGQAEGHSNIAGKSFQLRFWNHAEVIDRIRPEQEPFVAVLGLHSSGSSCLAGVLHHLGVHMGNEFTGYYGSDPDSKACGFEAVGLSALCEQALPFPECEPTWPKQQLERRLRIWINEKRREAAGKETVAGGKYPQLCRMGDALQSVCLGQLKVIVSSRPIEQSIESLQKRFPGSDPSLIDAHQRWLEKGKQDLLSRLDQNQFMTVDYETLLENPAGETRRIAAFLELEPTMKQLQNVVEWVDPALQHVKG